MLEKNGCPEKLVQKIIEEQIDGDTLRYMQVEDIMRVCGLADDIYKARGLYAKIWRILGITIVGEITVVQAVDSKPTGASLVKIVQKLSSTKASGASMSVSLSDETSRYVKMEIKEEDKDTSTIEQGEVSTATSVQTTSDRPAYPEGKSVEGSVPQTGMGQMTQQQLQQFQMYQYQLQQQQLRTMNTSIQPDTAGKDGLKD